MVPISSAFDLLEIRKNRAQRRNAVLQLLSEHILIETLEDCSFHSKHRVIDVQTMLCGGYRLATRTSVTVRD